MKGIKNFGSKQLTTTENSGRIISVDTRRGVAHSCKSTHAFWLVCKPFTVARPLAEKSVKGLF